jgi:ABC-type multidrug transport system fused ATPase/permease subunit
MLLAPSIQCQFDSSDSNKSHIIHFSSSSNFIRHSFPFSPFILGSSSSTKHNTKHFQIIYRNSPVLVIRTGAAAFSTSPAANQSPFFTKRPKRANLTHKEITDHASEMSLLEPPIEILSLLQESFPDQVTSDSDSGQNEDVLTYIAFLAAGMAAIEEFSPSVWKDELMPYLEDLPLTEEHVEQFRLAVEKATLQEDDADSYGDEEDDMLEEVCNLRFNLAYGGKILLRESKLRLLRGRRYALVGQNGVGKSNKCTQGMPRMVA